MNHSTIDLVLALILLFSDHSLLMADEADHKSKSREGASVSKATIETNGFRVHAVESPYQAAKTTISILLPNSYDVTQKYRVAYVLPVEANDGTVWGRALDEVKRLDLHNKYRLICVYPTFSHVPWYADHATDARIRQESHFLKVVVPFIDREYATIAEPRGRLLVGFSKSGWGAFTLLLRNPETFGRAAAWDAPFGIEKIDRFNIQEIFGTQGNFEKYRVSNLLRTQGKKLGEKPRLILAGANAFEREHTTAHDLMARLGIPHIYYKGAKVKHAWEGGWLTKAVELLAAESK